MKMRMRNVILLCFVLPASVYAEWTLDGRLPQGLHHHGSVSIGNGILVFGGLNLNVNTDLAYIYYPGGSLNLNVASVPIGTHAMAYVSHGNKAYSIAGYRGGRTGYVWSYDPFANTWSAETPLAFTRENSAAASLGSKIYVIGGHHEGGGGHTQSLVQAYNPSQGGSWETVAPLIYDRSGMGAVTANGKIYVVGGYSYHYPPSATATWRPEIEVYDPATDTWTLGPSMPTPRWRFATALLGNQIYTIGGIDSDNQILTTVEYFDIGLQQWFSDDPFPIPIFGATATVNDGKLYVLGGTNDYSWSSLDTVYVKNVPPLAHENVADFGILSLNGGSLIINSANSIIGDVGYSSGVTSETNQKVDLFDGSALVHSQVHTFNYTAKNFAPSVGILYGQDDAKLNGANAEAIAASVYYGALPATHVLGDLGDNDSIVVQSVGNLNIISINSLKYKEDFIELISGLDDYFVLNVYGSFEFAASQVVLTGTNADHVLFNFLGNNSDIVIKKSESEFYGTILAPRANVEYHNPGTFVGAIIGSDLNLHSNFNLIHEPFDYPSQ